jgi:hypothetical protein
MFASAYMGKIFRLLLQEVVTEPRIDEALDRQWA